HSRRDELRQMRDIKIGHTDVGDLALPAQALQLESRLDIARFGEIPPVKLHYVEPLHAQSLQGALYSACHVCGVDFRQRGQVWNELGVDAYPPRQIGMARAKLADHFLHTGVNIRAVEGGNAAPNEFSHFIRRPGRIYRTMVAGELPASLDDP